MARMRWTPSLVLSVLLLGLACGGRSIHHGEGGAAGDDTEGTGALGAMTGGTTGGRSVTGGTGGAGMGRGAASGVTGGTGMGARAGIGGAPMNPPQFCDFNGLILSVGQSTEDPRFCQTCTCQPGGEVDCKQCDITCRVAASTIKVGQNLLMPDGCTNCVCTVTGVDCDSSGCAVPDPCRDLATEYEIAVGAARWCGREYGNYRCTSALRTKETIPCGCNVLVRELESITPIANAYIDMGCPSPPTCETMCQEPRAPYRCSEAGFCTGDI